MFAVVDGQNLFTAGVTDPSPSVLLPVLIMGLHVLVELANLLESFTTNFTWVILGSVVTSFVARCVR